MTPTKNSFYTETSAFIANHKLLCGLTLGLAIVVYAIGNLGGRAVSWIRECCGTAKKTDGVAKDFLNKKGTIDHEIPVQSGSIHQISHVAPTVTSIKVANTQTYYEQLAQLNKEIISIQESYRVVYEKTDEQSKQSKTNLITQYENKIREKVTLVIANVPKGYQRFIAMTLPGKIAAGITFYHATKSTASIDNILRQGIISSTTKIVETEQEAHKNNFNKPELGQGLYLSQAAGYAGEGYNTALVVETTKEVQTIRVEYRGSFLNKQLYRLLELNENDIQNGLTYLEEHYSIIQREGLPPREEEIVIRNPQNHFKPKEIAHWDEHAYKWEKNLLLKEDVSWNVQWQT